MIMMMVAGDWASPGRFEMKMLLVMMMVDEASDLRSPGLLLALFGTNPKVQALFSH